MVTTSKTRTISLRGNRSGSQAENVYLSTRVTRLGPDGDYQYTVDILQHRRSSEGGFVAPVLVGVRDSGNPNKITWNDNAPDIIKKPWNNDKIITNVKDQVRSIEDLFVQNSKNVEDYRRENGIRSYGTDTFPEAASSQPVQNTINPNRTPSKPPRAPLVYPLTLATDDQDYIKFSILERKPNKIKGGTTQGRGFASQRVIGGAGGAVVYLPIPGGLSESTSVSYKESSLNALQLEGVTF